MFSFCWIGWVDWDMVDGVGAPIGMDVSIGSFLQFSISGKREIGSGVGGRGISSYGTVS
jgi:hypothetical protein